MLLSVYYGRWIRTYKEGHIRDITVSKYWNTHKYIEDNFPKLQIEKMNRQDYQEILNEYAETHERTTVIDFHHMLKAGIRDAYHDGVIKKDPTYRAVMKGMEPRKKKNKFLHPDEIRKLVSVLDLGQEINADWFILFLLKTGLRFAEALALTTDDFDWENQLLNVDKTLFYKDTNIRFVPTKNTFSVRKIAIDWQIIGQFKPLLNGLEPDELIFLEKDDKGKYKRPFNSTYNNRLAVLCKQAGVPVITLHSLRHTHASLLLSQSVSIQTISKRLGHSKVTTTQEVYAHVLKDLEAKDNQKMIGVLSQLGV